MTPSEWGCLAFLATISYKYPNIFCAAEAQWRYLKVIWRVHPESNNIVLGSIFRASAGDLFRISGSFKERNPIWIHTEHNYTESSFKVLLNEWFALTITNLTCVCPQTDKTTLPYISNELPTIQTPHSSTPTPALLTKPKPPFRCLCLPWSRFCSAALQCFLTTVPISNTTTVVENTTEIMVVLLFW